MIERNYQFKIEKGKTGSLFSLDKGGYFTNEDPITYISGIRVEFERTSDYGSLMYRTSNYKITSPNNAAKALENGVLVTFEDGGFPYVSLYASTGDFDIKSVFLLTASTKNTLDENDDIEIFSINDMHGAIEYNVTSAQQIGASRLASYYQSETMKNPDGSIVLSSGDMWQGSADSNITSGLLMTEWMNLVGFEAMAIGNHEFDWGIKQIATNDIAANFPFLGINIVDENNNRPSWAKASQVIYRQGVKIGLIGAIGKLESSIAKSSLGGYSFLSNYPSLVSAEASRLRKEEGCSLVFLSIHNPSFDTDACSNIDAVLEGHSHTYTSTVDSYGIPHIQCYANGSMVQRLVFKKDINGNYKFASKDQFGYQQSSSLQENAAFEDLYSYFAEVIGVVKNEVVGTTDTGYTKEEIGKIGAKALYNYAKKTYPEYNVVVSFINTAGVRQKIGAGQITFGEIYAAFPFDNYNDICSIRGSALKSFMSGSYYYSYFASNFALEENKVYNVITLSYVSESSYGANLSIKERDDYFLRNIVGDYFREGNI